MATNQKVRGSNPFERTIGKWLNLVEHLVWDQGVAGSNPVFPTSYYKHYLWYCYFFYLKYIREENQEELTDISLGIDLGLKDLAICSDGTVYKNINKTYMVRKIEKRLKRLQKQVSRKYEKNKKGKEYVKTKNIIKLEKQIQQVHRRLANIRNNYLQLI